MEGILDFSKLQESNQVDLFDALETQINGGNETTPGEQKNDDKTTKKDDKNEEVVLNVLDVLSNDNKETKEGTTGEEGLNKETTKAPPQQNSKSSVPFSLVFKSLIEEDALSNFDEEEFKKDEEESGTAVAIVNVFKKEAELAKQSALQEVEADKKEVLSIYSSLLDAGVESDTAKQLLSDKIKFEQISTEDLEAEANQALRIAVISQDLKNSGLNEKKIKTIVQNFIDTGKDVEEAKEAHTNVIEFNKNQIKLAAEQSKQTLAQQEAQRKEIIKNYTEFIDKMDEPLPGIKVNKQTKEKVKNTVLTGELWKIREKDPIKFDSIVAYAVKEAGLLDGKFDKIQSKAKSNAISELSAAISSTKKTSGNPVLDIQEDKPDEAVLNFLSKNKKQGF